MLREIKMRKTAVLGLFAAVVVLVSGCGESQNKAMGPGQHPLSFEKEVTVVAKLDYLIYVPKDYEPSQKWPLVMFLHGAGERGDDLNAIKRHGLPMLAEQRDFPFIIVSPQCSRRNFWASPSQLQVLNGLLDDVMATYSVDDDRVYLTGLSMGGMGAWAWAAANPERFAAVVPICGRGNPETGVKLKDMPIWAFHGDADYTVPVKGSQEMVEAVNNAGGNAKLTIYPGVGHESWIQTYENPEVYEWMLSHTR